MHSMIDLHSFIFSILFVGGCWFIVVVRRCRSLSVRACVVVHAFEFLRQLFFTVGLCLQYKLPRNCKLLIKVPVIVSSRVCSS